MKLETGQLICVERKQKNPRTNKWKRWSKIYIYLENDLAMGFRGGKPIKINVEDEIEKGNRVERIFLNIAIVLKDYWKIDFNKFYSEFKIRSGE